MSERKHPVRHPFRIFAPANVKTEFKYLFFFFALTILSSCVTKKKFLQLDNQLQEQRVLTQNYRLQIDSLQKANFALNDSLIELDSLLAFEQNKHQKKVNNGTAPKKSTISKSEEYDKKSVYLFTFSKQVIWPEIPKGEKFTIGILGSSLIYDKLKKTAADKKVMGKPVAIKTVSVAEISECQMLFIPHAQIGELNKVRNLVKGKNILLITEEGYATGLQSHINFNVDDNRIRYKVNRDVAEKAGFKLTPDLLSFSD